MCIFDLVISLCIKIHSVVSLADRSHLSDKWKVVECLVIIVQKHNILWHYSLFCIIPQGVKELWKFCKYSSMKGWKNKSACPTVFHIANRDKMNCKSWPWKLHLAIQIIERGDLRTVMLPYTFTQLSGRLMHRPWWVFLPLTFLCIFIPPFPISSLHPPC